MNDFERLDNMRTNIERERERLGYTQQQMADAIGMSLSSYRRMLSGELNLRASIVIRNLFFLTGKCCWEFMEESTPVLEVGRKLRRLDKEELKAIEAIVDHLIEKHH